MTKNTLSEWGLTSGPGERRKSLPSTGRQSPGRMKMQYAIIQAGYIGAERWPHTPRGLAAAKREADRLNADADDDCGYEVVGDGAASLVEVES